MNKEYLIQYGAIIVSLIALFIDRKEIKKYIPVAIFASLYANIFCYIAIFFNLWTYQKRLFPIVKDISATVNVIVIPIITIIWLKHIPDTLKGKVIWAFIWTIGLTLVEYLLERYTEIITYHNGYDFYYSFILWFFTWFIWAAYYKWQLKTA